ncbi:MAG: DUF2147 domain-containing protein [Betaproteobacteria bacterium]|nr:DUF2147 domain-containing protein [Betaproteobacteria bacterium]
MRQTLVSILLLGAVGWAQAQMSPIGLWQSIDDGNGQPKAEIVIVQRADGGLSGKVESSLLANPSAEANCVLCSDDRKNQPKIGLEIIRGGHKAEGKDVWEGGKILDPDNGKEYSLRLTPIDGGRKLEVRGYIGAPILGRTQTWNRIR